MSPHSSPSRVFHFQQRPHKAVVFVVSILAGMLAACSLPISATNAPPTITNPETAPLPSTVTLTAPPPTETTLPPTETALPPTTTRAPGPVVILDQIHMLNVNDGWGWASKAGKMTQLLRTSDGGQTWLDVSPQAEFNYYNSFFLNAQAAWLPYYDLTSNTGGILRTLDGGQNWLPLSPNPTLQNAWVEFTSLTEGLAETADMGAGNAYLNYYQTQDGGLTWKPVLLTSPTPPEPNLPVGTIHLCSICGDSLYYDSTRVIITYGDLASDPVGKVRLSISTDLGQHWKDLQLALPDQKYVDGSAAPLSPTFFGTDGLMPVNIIKYAQDGSLAFSVLVLYTSQDGGQSWQAAPAILEKENANLASVQILSTKTAFTRCGKNLCSTHDGAHSWQTLPDNLNFDQSAGGPDYVSQFAFTDSSNGWAISGEGGATSLWKSKDGGVTWKKLSPTLAQ